MENAIEKQPIASLHDWPRAKKLCFVGAFLAYMIANQGNNFAITTFGAAMAEQWGQMSLFSLVFTIPMFLMLVFQPACNQIASKVGVGNCLIFSQVITTILCFASAVATSMVTILIARCGICLACCFLIAVGMGSYPLMFKQEECAKYVSLYGTAMSISLVIFPTFAGVVFDATGEFFIPLALSGVFGILGTALAIYAKPPRHTDPKASGSLDFPGILTLGIALFCAVYLFSFGGVQFQWLSLASVALVVIALVSAFAFIKVEKKQGDSAILPLRLFQHRGFTVALLAGIFIGIPDCIMVTYLPTYAQAALGHNATIGGLFSSVPGALAVVTSTAFGILLTKKGCYRSLFAFSGVLALFACAGMCFFDASSNIWFVIAFMTATWGLAYSVFKFIPTALGQAYVPAEDAPVCTNAINNFTVLGCTFGLALASVPMTVFAGDMLMAFKCMFIISAIGAAISTLIVVFGLKKGAE